MRAFFADGFTIVQLNAAGPGGAESEIALSGSVTLDAGDFIL